MNKFDKLYNLIFEELTDKQKKDVDFFAAKRDIDLTFGPIFKEERTYFPIEQTNLNVLETPREIQYLLDQEGYYCPDYRQGYAYKKEDNLKNKPVKLIKVLHKSLSYNPDKFNQLKKEFDERLKSNRKENIKCLICITHNPYDIAGMSTDRNWTSCMNLETGCHKQTAYRQVQYGGMCAYLIKEDDKDIKEPIARIAIKRFVHHNEDKHKFADMFDQKEKKSFIFVAEPKIYGDEHFGKEIQFDVQVNEILEKSNKLTKKDKTIVYRNLDNYSWTDRETDEYIDITNPKFDQFIKKHPNRINWRELVRLQKLPVDFILKYFHKFEEDDLILYQTLNDQILEKILEYFPNSYYFLKRMAKLQPLTEQFIKKHIDQFKKFEKEIFNNNKISQQTKDSIKFLFN